MAHESSWDADEGYMGEQMGYGYDNPPSDDSFDYLFDEPAPPPAPSYSPGSQYGPFTGPGLASYGYGRGGKWGYLGQGDFVGPNPGWGTGGTRQAGPIGPQRSGSGYNLPQVDQTDSRNLRGVTSVITPMSFFEARAPELYGGLTPLEKQMTTAEWDTMFDPDVPDLTREQQGAALRGPVNFDDYDLGPPALNFDTTKLDDLNDELSWLENYNKTVQRDAFGTPFGGSPWVVDGQSLLSQKRTARDAEQARLDKLSLMPNPPAMFSDEELGGPPPALTQEDRDDLLDAARNYDPNYQAPSPDFPDKDFTIEDQGFLPDSNLNKLGSNYQEALKGQHDFGSAFGSLFGVTSPLKYDRNAPKERQWTEGTGFKPLSSPLLGFALGGLPGFWGKAAPAAFNIAGSVAKGRPVEAVIGGTPFATLANTAEAVTGKSLDDRLGTGFPELDTTLLGDRGIHDPAPPGSFRDIPGALRRGISGLFSSPTKIIDAEGLEMLDARSGGTIQNPLLSPEEKEAETKALETSDASPFTNNSFYNNNLYDNSAFNSGGNGTDNPLRDRTYVALADAKNTTEEIAGVPSPNRFMPKGRRQKKKINMFASRGGETYFDYTYPQV